MCWREKAEKGKQSADHWQRRHLNKSLKEVRQERCRCQEKRVLGRENSPCEGPRVGTCLVYSGNSERNCGWRGVSEGASGETGEVDRGLVCCGYGVL